MEQTKKERLDTKIKKMSRSELIEIGRRIKIARKALRYSQRELAKELEMSHSYLSEIESGKARPKPEFFLKLSKKFGMSTDYLYHGTGDMFYAAWSQRKAEINDFDFDSELQTIEQMVWLMENSTVFKNTVMGFASKFLLDNEKIIKKSMAKANKSGKKGKNLL
jgi:transcriptional regulator with XRE-family HTH domain